MKQWVKWAVCTLLATTATASSVAAGQPTGMPTGTTISGRVTLDGRPAAGVTVSDGVLLCTTDSAGMYYLASHKRQGTVFVITPSGTEPAMRKGVLPQFWAPLTEKPYLPERHDFELRTTDQSRVRLLAMASLQLSARNNDLSEFAHTVLPAVRTACAEATREGRRTYTLLLGDLSLGLYWYASEFDLKDVRNTLLSSNYPTPIYAAMGDADNDASIPYGATTDYEAERMYCLLWGPKYYAANIGAAHVVVLDDIVFRNEASKNGNQPLRIKGRRNYDTYVSMDQLQWLRKELAQVSTTQPLVVCMHEATMRTQGHGTLTSLFTKSGLFNELMEILRPFRSVTLLTAGGHRYRVSRPADYPCLTELTLSSVSGSGWGTLPLSRHSIGMDGADAAFEVVDITAPDKIAWYCHSLYSGHTAMRVYDMNSVRDYYNRTPLVRKYIQMAPTRYDYGEAQYHNNIFINYWGYEEGTRLEVLENGKKLPVKKISYEDPMQTVVWEVMRCEGDGFKPNPRNGCTHMFRAVATDSLSTVTVRSTDRFGRRDSVVMKRPCSFEEQLQLTGRRKK